MEECFVYVVALDIADPEMDKVFVKVGVSYMPDLQLKQLQLGSPHRLVLHACFRLPSQIFAQRVERRFHLTNKPWAADAGWVKGIPLVTVEEVARDCVEEWIADGHRAVHIASFCDRAGISCSVFAGAIVDFIEHPTLTDETP